ncbi:hypothetical protein [Nocardia sp. NPDC050406]|uniref:hypothetical protein n=1 Tax=Nocardia sp. NPDC050406 TaxID=3364318 RepID=UPI0037BC4CA4
MLHSDPERLGTTELADGRTLAWSEWGPRDGTAVLFCTGAGWGAGSASARKTLPPWIFG